MEIEERQAITEDSEENDRESRRYDEEATPMNRHSSLAADTTEKNEASSFRIGYTTSGQEEIKTSIEMESEEQKQSHISPCSSVADDVGDDDDDDDSAQEMKTRQELLSEFDSQKESLVDEIENALLRSKDETKASTNNIHELGGEMEEPSEEEEDLPIEESKTVDDQRKGIQSQHNNTPDDDDSDALFIPQFGTNTTIDSIDTPHPDVNNSELQDERTNIARISPQTVDPENISDEAQNHSSKLQHSSSSNTLMSLPEIGTKTTIDSNEHENLNEQYSWKDPDEDNNNYTSNGSIQQTSESIGVRVETPPLLANKSNDTLMSIPDIGTNTTSETAASSPDEIIVDDDDETDSRADVAGSNPQERTPMTSTICDDEEENGSNTMYSNTAGDIKTEPTSDGLLTIADTEALSTDDTDSDSTASRPLLQNLSEEALRLYERDNLNNSGRHKTDPAVLEQIMPQQPERIMSPGTLLDLSGTQEEEEKTEVHEDYSSSDSSVHQLEQKEGNIEVLPEPVADDEDQPDVPIIKNTRPEYISATILKVEAEFEHGLEFMSLDGELRISSISPTGLFWNSPLKPFDKLLRINNLNCETLEPANASHLLDVLKGFILIIVQNIGGDSCLIESQVSKPHPQSETGITFQDIFRDAVLLKNEVEITNMGTKSLFTGSLLHVGDRVLSVNQCVDLDSNIIDVMLQTAPKHITILARTKLKTQMAIARRPTHQLPPGFNVVRATEEARRQRAELQRKQGCYYNMFERPGACANFFQWAGNVYVITIVIVGVAISWSTVKAQTYDGSDTVGTILKFMGLFVGGILLGLFVNAPWWFRKVGARFSVAQLVCNAIVIASFFVLTRFFDSADLVQDYRLVIFFAIFFPLLIIVNLPTIFVKRDNGSDGNTISDRSPESDDLSSNSSLISDNA